MVTVVVECPQGAAKGNDRFMSEHSILLSKTIPQWSQKLWNRHNLNSNTLFTWMKLLLIFWWIFVKKTSHDNKICFYIKFMIITWFIILKIFILGTIKEIFWLCKLVSPLIFFFQHYHGHFLYKKTKASFWQKAIQWKIWWVLGVVFYVKGQKTLSVLRY